MKNIHQLNAWAVIGLIVLFVVLFEGAQYPIFLITHLIKNPIGRALGDLFFGCVLLGAFGLLLSKLEEKSIRFSIKKLLTDLGIGLLIGAVCICAVILGLMLLGNYHIESLTPTYPSLSLLLSFGFYFVIACCEEIVFRGIILHFIQVRWNIVISLIMSSLLFGVIHLFNDGLTWTGCLSITLVGFMLGLSYLQSGSIWMPVGIHWIWNVLEESIFGSAVSGNSSEQSLFRGQYCGSDLLTGGSCGIEGSILTMIVIAIGCIIFLWLMRGRWKKLR